MSKDRLCHHHEFASLIQDILNVIHDSLRWLAKKKTMILSDTRTIIQDRIDISVRDITIHENEKYVR